MEVTIGLQVYENVFVRFITCAYSFVFSKYIIYKFLFNIQVVQSSKDENPKDVIELARKLDVHLTQEEIEQSPKELMKIIMKKWLPAGDSMLEMIALHLPSPLEAQKYRMEILYEGPLDDEAALGKNLFLDF